MYKTSKRFNCGPLQTSDRLLLELAKDGVVRNGVATWL